MHGLRFDALARSFSTGFSRREIALLLSGLTGGALLGFRPEFRETSAHDKRAKCKQLNDKDKRKRCLKQAKQHQQQHEPQMTVPPPPVTVPPPPGTTCPASAPIVCGVNCCRSVSPLCCGDQNAPGGTRCFQSSYQCCPAEIGGGACPNTEACCPPRKGDTMILCANTTLGEHCCPPGSGGFCTQSRACCAAEKTNGLNRGCCSVSSACCNVDEDCPEVQKCGTTGCCRQE